MVAYGMETTTAETKDSSNGQAGENMSEQHDQDYYRVWTVKIPRSPHPVVRVRDINSVC